MGAGLGGFFVAAGLGGFGVVETAVLDSGVEVFAGDDVGFFRVAAGASDVVTGAAVLLCSESPDDTWSLLSGCSDLVSGVEVLGCCSGVLAAASCTFLFSIASSSGVVVVVAAEPPASFPVGVEETPFTCASGAPEVNWRINAATTSNDAAPTTSNTIRRFFLLL